MLRNSRNQYLLFMLGSALVSFLHIYTYVYIYVCIYIL